VPIPDRDGEHATGRAGRGDMKLYEMFEPKPGLMYNDLSDVDWADDLKFFIDNENSLLEKHIFPAVEKHQRHAGHPNCYRFYVKPIIECIKVYVKRFEIEEPKKIFTREIVESIAKKISEEQEKHIKDGDYKSDEDL